MSGHLIKQSILDAAFCSQVVDADGSMELTIEGQSMLPTLKKGQLVRVTAEKKVTPGRAYLFQFHRSLLVHRAVKCRDGNVWFLGDNCFHPEIVRRDSVVGVVDEGRTSFFYDVVAGVNVVGMAVAQKILRGSGWVNRFRRMIIWMAHAVDKKMVTIQGRFLGERVLYEGKL